MNDKKILTEEELEQIAGGQEECNFNMYQCTNEIELNGSKKICGKQFLTNNPCPCCPECGCTDITKLILKHSF